MLQLPVIVILIVSTFVSTVSPELQNEEHEKVKAEVVTNLNNATKILSNSTSKVVEASKKMEEDKENVTTNLNNAINVSADNPKKIAESSKNGANLNNTINNSTSGNKTVESSIKAGEDKKESGTEIKISTSSSTPPTMTATDATNVQTAKNVKQNCTSRKEQEDMLQCNVMPHDDDDIIEQDTALNSAAKNATLTASKNTTVAATKGATTTVANNVTPTTVHNNTTTTATKTETTVDSQAPKVLPQKNQQYDKSIKTVVNNTETNDQVPYDVDSTTHQSSNISSPDVSLNTPDSKHDNSTKKASNSSVPPVLVSKIIASTETEKVVGAVKAAEQDEDKHMPSGIIALVTAISFAVAIALVYIGMIIWRRYVEYRYGHRELLVNELEFDTSDLRHFEL